MPSADDHTIAMYVVEKNVVETDLVAMKTELSNVAEN